MGRLSPLLVSKLNLHKSPEGTVLAGNVQPGARAAGAQLWLFNHSNSTFHIHDPLFPVVSSDSVYPGSNTLPPLTMSLISPEYLSLMCQ